MIRVFVVEDNKRQLMSTRAKLEQVGFQMTGSASTSIEALSLFKTCDPDVILMDINLAQDGEGILLAKELQKKTDVPIIFTTALTSTEVAKKAIGINPAGYLIKPINPIELKANIELVVNNYKDKQSNKAFSNETNKPDYLTIRVGQKLNRIFFKEIVYLKVDTKNYVSLIDRKKKSYVVRESLKQMIENELPSSFLRTHTSFAVNIEFIDFIDEQAQQVYLIGGVSVPIGRAFKDSVYKRMNIK